MRSRRVRGPNNKIFSLLYAGSASSSCCCNGGDDGGGSTVSDGRISANCDSSSLNLAALTTASLERFSTSCCSSWMYCLMCLSLVISWWFSSFCSSTSTSSAADCSVWTDLELAGCRSDDTCMKSAATTAAAAADSSVAGCWCSSLQHYKKLTETSQTVIVTVMAKKRINWGKRCNISRTSLTLRLYFTLHRSSDQSTVSSFSTCPLSGNFTSKPLTLLRTNCLQFDPICVFESIFQWTVLLGLYNTPYRLQI